MDKLYIVIPAYNESVNIKEVILQWYAIVKRVSRESRLIVIDDGSKDDTLAIARGMQGSCTQLEVLTKPNGGHGATLLYGYRYAIRAGADYIFQTDSDGQTIPEEFWQLWDSRELAGLLIGWRQKRQDGLHRTVITRVLKLVICLTFRVWIKDANTPFRLMRADELKQVIKKIPRDYHLANVMVSVIYKRQGRYVGFYPISFLDRQGGTNSINVRKIAAMGTKASVEFLKLGRDR